MRPSAERELTVVLLMLLPSPALASELTFEGYYRARGLYYNSLSLTDTAGNEYAEGASAALDHRFTLRPTWLLSDHAALHAQIDLLPYAAWGTTTATAVDPVSGDTGPRASADGVTTDGAGLVAVRAWGEAKTGIGTFSAGRMPMEWGAGILWNPGDAADAEAGDSADRLQYTKLFGQVWTMAAFDVQYEGLLNEGDDMQSASLALAWRNETTSVGLLNNYRYQKAYSWQAYTGDLWGHTTLGPVEVETEIVGVFGGGNTETGGNDLSQMAFGGMLNGQLALQKMTIGVEGGFATGDENPDDGELHTFTFDRDHNVSLLLFEDNLPTLAAKVATDTNAGRTTAGTLTQDGIANALYLRPSARYLLRPDLRIEVDWLTATLAKGPADTLGRHGYGNEFDLRLRYDPYAHVWVEGAGGLLLPGKYYSQYTDPELGGGYSGPAWAARLTATVEF